MPPLPRTTSLTLLGRLRNPEDVAAWREFDVRYRELIVWFARRRGLQAADAEDCAAVVIGKLVSGLRSFAYDHCKAGFRAYLYRCVRSSLADHFSRQAKLGGVVVESNGVHDSDAADAAGASDGDLFSAFEREWVDHHYRLAVRRYRTEADERAIAMLEGMLVGKPARLIGEELFMSEPAVHKAQQRLRDRLRMLIAEQLRDEESRDA